MAEWTIERLTHAKDAIAFANEYAFPNLNLSGSYMREAVRKDLAAALDEIERLQAELAALKGES